MARKDPPKSGRTPLTRGNDRAKEIKAHLKVSDRFGAEYQKLKNKKGWTNANTASSMELKSAKAFQKAAGKALETRAIKNSVKKKK